MALDYRRGYVDGNTVRKTAPVQNPQDRRQKNQRSARRRREAEKVSYVNFFHMAFLAAAACLVLVSCVHYLQLQAETTNRVKHIAQLETQLEEMKKENDDNYTRIQTSVDLNYIKDVAINELGMVYAQPDQVILYDGGTKDYVRQSGDIPQEESSSLKSLGSKLFGN